MEKLKNGEMLEWMKNFVEINNLVVGKDIKLDELKVEGRWGLLIFLFGIGIIKLGIKIKMGFKFFGLGLLRGLGFLRSFGGISGIKFCLFFGVVKKGGISFVGFCSFGGRFVILGKGFNR